MAMLDRTPTPAPPEPVELDEAAHVLLWGLRAIAIGRGDCPVLRRAFMDLCGGLGDEALNVLFVLVKQMAFRSRRRLRLHAPGCCGISSDELIFLSALAAAQGSNARDGAWLSSLIGRDVDPSLAGSLRALAQLLSASGQRIEIGQEEGHRGLERRGSLH